VPGAFYTGDGPRGPLALPGEYQVKLTAAGKSQTAPLQLVIDPRTKGNEPQLPKSFALATQVNERISQLHQAINEIRDIKSQIQTLHRRFGNDEKLKAALTAADDVGHKMSEVEGQLIQVNAKGSEATLAFPSMLNERFDGFSHIIESDHEPTKAQQDVFKMLSDKLDEQLKKWTQIKTDEVPKISGMIKQLELPALSIPPKPDETKKGNG
jgi:seryl-tRNA synthetase